MLINVYFLKLPQQSTHSWGWTAICVCRGRYVFSQPQLFIKQILTYMDYNNLSVPDNEFDRLTGRDLDNLKSLVTTPDVNVRAPYGTTKERRTRIASYCASGNKLQFLTDQTGNRRFLPFYVDSIDSPFDHKIPHRAMYDEAVWLIEHGNFDYWFTLDEIDRISGYVEQFADNPPEDELLDVYFDVPRTDPDNPETRQVTFLTPAEISAKLTTWGNLKKPISIRKLNVLMEKKGYQRIRHGGKRQRGFLVVELEASTINSNRIVSTSSPVF